MNKHFFVIDEIYILPVTKYDRKTPTIIYFIQMV